MNKHQATKLANDAIKTVAVGEPESVADTTVLILETDGTYCVTDNGEEVNGLSKADAIRIIVENLMA